MNPLIGTDSGLALIVLGACVLIAHRLATPERLRARQTLVSVGWLVSGWVTIIVGTFALTLAYTFVMLFAVIFWCTALGVAAMIVVRRHRASLGQLLQLAAMAVDRGLPMTDVLVAASKEGASGVSHAARSLATIFGGGVTFLEARPGLAKWLPKKYWPSMAVGLQLGRLRDALAAVPQDQHELTDSSRVIHRICVLSVTSWVVSVWLTYYSFSILPSFEEINASMVQEFGATAPLKAGWVTTLESAAPAVGRCMLLTVPITFLFVVLQLARFWGWEGSLCSILPRWLDPRDRATFLRLAALYLEEKRPLAEGMQLLSQVHGKRRMRAVIQQSLGGFKLGLPWTACLLQARIVTKQEAALLAAADQSGHAPWALRTLADHWLTHVDRRWLPILRLFSGLLFVICVVLTGMAAVSLFTYLIGFIEYAQQS